jgi:nitric oxide dioxygenase
MGGILASVMKQKEEEVIQTHTGMTPKQIDQVVHSWAEVKKFGAEKAGIILFKRFFIVAPETFKMFEDFRDEGNWEESKQFKHHCKIVMNIVGSAVGLLKDPESLDSTLEYLGMKHEGFEISAKHFELMGVELLETLREILKNDMTSEVENAWLAMYKYITNIIVLGMNRMEVGVKAVTGEAK